MISIHTMKELIRYIKFTKEESNRIRKYILDSDYLSLSIDSLQGDIFAIESRLLREKGAMIL